MKETNGGGAGHRMGALVLAAATLWIAAAAAGSENAASALDALRQSAALPFREAAFRPADDGGGESGIAYHEASRGGNGAASHPSSHPASRPLSLLTAVALSQSPVLYSLWNDGLRNPGGLPSSDAMEPMQTEPDSTRQEAAFPGEETPESVQRPEDAGNPDTIPPAANLSGNPDTAPPMPDPVSENAESVPLHETPIPAPEAVDNGVAARTLIPTDPSGYTVCGRVYISSSRSDTLSISDLREPFDAELTADAPQILILHSHGSEAYTPVPGTEVVWSGDSRTTDFRYSVVHVGDEMASVFQNAGITVLHDRTLYDYPNYTGSYDRSLAAIHSYLAQYPSIRFILDLHRDYIADGKGRPYKVISEIEGVGKAAQLTLVMGSDGSGAAHPRWKENLKLAVALQEQILSRYPTLMRPILLRKSRYNQHATTGSLLVEVGAAGNAPEEAALSARLFAEQMVEVLEARSK